MGLSSKISTVQVYLSFLEPSKSNAAVWCGDGGCVFLPLYFHSLVEVQCDSETLWRAVYVVWQALKNRRIVWTGWLTQSCVTFLVCMNRPKGKQADPTWRIIISLSLATGNVQGRMCKKQMRSVSVLLIKGQSSLAGSMKNVISAPNRLLSW